MAAVRLRHGGSEVACEQQHRRLHVLEHPLDALPRVRTVEWHKAAARKKRAEDTCAGQARSTLNNGSYV